MAQRRPARQSFPSVTELALPLAFERDQTRAIERGRVSETATSATVAAPPMETSSCNTGLRHGHLLARARMNLLDLAIVIMALVGGIGGWRFGLIARVLAWCGVAVALLVGIPYVPRVVTAFGGTSTDNRVTVAVLFLVLVATLGHAVGLAIGALVHRYSTPRPLPRWDRVLGAVVGSAGVIAFVWVTTPSLTTAHGWPARLAGSSAIVGFVDDLSPELPPQFAVVGREIANAPYPSVPDPLDAPPSRGVPPKEALAAAVDTWVRASIVKVRGEACGQIQAGSGWVTTTGLVVTNAHVVAGDDDVMVEDTGGNEYRADVVRFDVVRDLAVLRVIGLDAPGLELGTGHVDDRGAVYGHPGGGDLRVAPARVTDTYTAIVSDIYGDPTTSPRHVFALAAALEPGDSGAALINEKGAVIGVAFAVVEHREDASLAISIDEVRPVIDGIDPRAIVETGRCLRR